jgi:hypothetical protein
MSIPEVLLSKKTPAILPGVFFKQVLFGWTGFLSHSVFPVPIWDSG